MKYLVTFLFCCVWLSFFSCSKNGGFETQNKNDSLFLGFTLGMDRQAFFDYCWEQNKKKKFIHGPGNRSVEYRLVGILDQPVAMRFYPNFHDDKIFEMPVTFSYEGWAPWNKQYWADTLLTKMLPVFKQWYGDDFKKLDHPTMGAVYYKIDGKRRINLFKRDDQFVQAVFTDLKVEKELKAAYGERMGVEAK